jgi:hypothetical protein
MSELTELERTALYYIESYYFEHRGFPPDDKLPPRFDLKKSLSRDAFKRALFERGIPVPRKRMKKSSVEPALTEEQMAAIMSVINHADKRSIKAKLETMGLTLTQWQGWLRQPKFKEVLHKVSAENFEDAIHHAHTGLITAMDRGEVHAIKLYMELSGRQKDSDPTLKNFRLVVSRIVEALQFRLRDNPELMAEIQSDLEIIFEGRQPDYSIVTKALPQSI